jgi:hypothetical protein
MDAMPRITMLLAALCIAAAPIVAVTHASAQKGTDKDQADKTTVSKPEAEKTEKFDLDGLIRGIKDMVDKGMKEDKPAITPATPAAPAAPAR